MIRYCTLSIGFIVCFSVTMAQAPLRSIEVLSADTTGWTTVKGWITAAKNKAEVLPSTRENAKEALFQVQVTTHAILGAIIYNTGGILIDSGWLRILGSASTKLNRSLPEWNIGKTFMKIGERPSFLLVADDAAGGFFAINAGALGTDTGKIYYLAPNSLSWENLELNYPEFIKFCFSGDLEKFYHGLRWPEWKKDAAGLSGSDGFFFYPFLWTKEGRDLLKDKRSIVPVNELYVFKIEAIRQLSR